MESAAASDVYMRVSSSEGLGVFKYNLVTVQELEKLADIKINKLIENSSQLTLQSNRLEE